MTKTIIGGGFTVIVAVFGILFFLLAVTIPLFQSADVEERQHPAPSSPVPGTWGLDPSGTLPFVYGNGKTSSSWTKLPGTCPPFPFPCRTAKPSAPIPMTHPLPPTPSPRNPARWASSMFIPDSTSTAGRMPTARTKPERRPALSTP
ncbi:hypothetical protein M5E88_12140 [Akkermansia muciniphila]|nr:hypothetical protein M5E88_12140 [Akkermansia muciniphila]